MNLSQRQITILNQMALGIVFFWFAWSSLVFIGDLCNWLQVHALIANDFPFNSHNFALVQTLFAHSFPSHWVSDSAFSCIVIVYAAITLLFGGAVMAYKNNTEKYIYLTLFGFLVSLAIEALFILGDEIFIQYELEHGHMQRLAFRCITLITFLILTKMSHRPPSTM